MKKFIGKSIMGVALLLCATSCYDDVRYDYEVTGMYFATQQPLRTVIAEGESIYDAGVIKVGVAIGGKLEVDVNDWATFVIDESLITDPSLTLMPSNYYTLSSDDTMVVSKSNNQICDVEIHFTDAFFADPLTSTSNVGSYYAIPFRMTNNSCDGTTLEGQDYTIVAIQYESKYSGVYYTQGAVYEMDGSSPSDNVQFYTTTDLNDGLSSTFLTTAYRTVVRPSHTVTVSGKSVATGDVAIKVIPAGEEMSDGTIATEISVEVTAADGNTDFLGNSGSGTIAYDDDTKDCVITIQYQTNDDDGGGSYLISETLTRRRDVFEEVSTTIQYWYATE